MAEASTERTADPFGRIHDHLKAVLDDLDEIRRTYIMVMSGPDLTTLLDVEHDERDLERDIELLHKRLNAHLE